MTISKEIFFFVLLILLFHCNFSFAGKMQNNSDQSIGNFYHNNDKINQIYDGKRIVNLITYPGDYALPVQDENAIYAETLMNELLLSCDNFKLEKINSLLQAKVPGIGTGDWKTKNNKFNIVSSAYDDARLLNSKFSCKSATLVRMYNNLLYQFLGITPISNNYTEMDDWGVKLNIKSIKGKWKINDNQIIEIDHPFNKMLDGHLFSFHPFGDRYKSLGGGKFIDENRITIEWYPLSTNRKYDGEVIDDGKTIKLTNGDIWKKM